MPRSLAESFKEKTFFDIYKIKNTFLKEKYLLYGKFLTLLEKSVNSF